MLNFASNLDSTKTDHHGTILSGTKLYVTRLGDIFIFPSSFLRSFRNIPYKKRNAPLRTVRLSGRSQGIGQLSFYQCKGMPGFAAFHVFGNQASKLC